jgi:hypothetical protein
MAPEARSHGQAGATTAARRPPIPPAIKRNTRLLAVTQAGVGMGNQMVPVLGAIMVLRLLDSPALEIVPWGSPVAIGKSYDFGEYKRSVEELAEKFWDGTDLCLVPPGDYRGLDWPPGNPTMRPKIDCRFKVSFMARVAADPSADLGVVRNASPKLHAALALLVLLVATVLAVDKPRGMPPYGWRQHHGQRTASQP